MTLLALPVGPGSAGQRRVWTETFADGHLDPARWQVTSAGDFRERDVRIVETPGALRRFQLALSADTRGTSDETIKVLGVRAVPRFELSSEARISFDVDWSGQANGSYLSAAAVLAPQATAGNALVQADWLKVEYIGVPPGKLARMVIAVRRQGRERTLYTEGWPERNRTGRLIGRQSLTITIRDRRAEIWENGALVYASVEPVVGFSAAHLYFQMASHSNFPRRTVHFGPVEIETHGTARQ